MKKIISLIVLCLYGFVSVSAATPIRGTTVASADRMYQFVKATNSSFDREIADQFYAVSKVYGIRGDIALCQSIIETGWFKYTGGTAVTPDDHNYCGLGVTTLGQKGCQFETVKDGVTAQMQHLYAYACKLDLPSGETLIDPRFKYVTRGSAPNWEDLSGVWSVASNYGSKILAMYEDMMAFEMAEASLKASVLDITLSGTYNATAPSKSVTITGTNLSSAIVYNSSSSAFKVSVSNWNDYTGGTLKVTLDTSKSPGTYEGYIAVQSGSGDNITRITINCTGTITSSGATIPALSFYEGWNYGETAGVASAWDAKLVRNFDYADGKLYCVYSNNSIKVIDARTGEYKKDLKVPSSVVSGGAYFLCDVKCIGGYIIACNLVASSGELRIYSWASDDAEPVLLHSASVSARTGDCMGVAGSVSGDLRLAFGSTTGVITEYSRTGGTWSVKTVETGLSSGSATRVIPVDNGYWIDGRGIYPTMVNASGVTQYTLAGESVADGNAFDTFAYNGKTYMMVSTYLNKTNTLAEGAMHLFDVTSGWGSATAIAYYPSAGLGPVRNTNLASSVVTNAGNDYAEAWISVLGQGLAYYKSGNAPSGGSTPSVNPAIAVSATELEFNTTEGSVVTKTLNVKGENLTGNISLALTGTDAAQFSLSSSTIAKSVASADITVKYSPIAAGSHTATLTVSTSGAESVKISLSGNATEEVVADGLKVTQNWAVTSNLPTEGDARWAAGYNGKIYTQDRTNKKLICWDGNSTTEIATGTAGWCLTVDEAGNLILQNALWGTGSTVFAILPAGKTSASDMITLEVTPPSGCAAGTMHTIGRAIGNVMSATGGAFYTLAQNQTRISKIFVANGAQVAGKCASIPLGVSDKTPGTQSVVQPVDNDINAIDNVIWTSRSVENRLMMLDGTAYTEYAFNADGTTPNTTAGGDIITLNGITYTIEPSGDNYSDGFVIVDRTNDKVVYSRESSKVSTVSQSYVAFEKISETRANVYHYTPGVIAAKYTFTVSKSSGVSSAVEESCDVAINVSGNTLSVSGADVESIGIYSVSGMQERAISNSNEIDIDGLAGFYVVVVEDIAGIVVARKIAIR